ncbi:MAG: GntR family transcriptional regulator [Phycisphaerae bacterium]|nr:GntR family transcriptional regulator [Phycisphaerae bacterium]
MDATVEPRVFRNGSPRAKAIATLREWIEQGRLQPGMPLPSERELCQHIGVGLATVQRALRVLTAEGLIQVRDGHTRLLANAASSTVSAILRQTLMILAPAQAPLAGHAQPGWSEYIGIGAAAAARQEGQGVLSLAPTRLLNQPSDRMLSVRPSGLLVCEMAGPQRQALVDFIRILSREGTPVVVYGNSPLDQEYDRVISDHEAGAYSLTRNLLQRGCRRILPLFERPEDMYWKKDRLAGYTRAMRESSLEPLPTLWVDDIGGRYTVEHFRVKSSYLAGQLVPHMTGPNPVDAIMAASDGEAFSVAAACRLFGRQPQKDIFLAGYDNYYGDSPEQEMESSIPSVTVDKQNFLIGQEMVQLLQARIAGNAGAGPQLRLVPPRLLVR